MTEPSSVPPTAEAEAAPNTVLPLVRLLPPPPPEGAILVPTEHEPARRSWFILDLWAELRLAVRMYFDPRYRLSRLAQIAFPAFFLLIALNYFLFSVWFSIAVVSPIVERLLDVILAVLAYRILARELDRYRAVLDYLARYTQR